MAFTCNLLRVDTDAVAPDTRLRKDNIANDEAVGEDEQGATVVIHDPGLKSIKHTKGIRAASLAPGQTWVWFTPDSWKHTCWYRSVSGTINDSQACGTDAFGSVSCHYLQVALPVACGRDTTIDYYQPEATVLTDCAVQTSGSAN
ncbi:hypothetical protein RRG08_048769 [Elysia crispata]|uniref:Uncharacterized protein n=1 Tax=Elysia crispata TaxID=231223 RepID=A0AAE1AMY1_9GAST|nr:hypothetical protein RRG08_048769 [Elysia crispata]